MIAERLTAGAPSHVAEPEALPGERVVCNENWQQIAAPSLSVLVPNYRDRPAKLLEALSDCIAADQIEVVIYDDGSDMQDLTEETVVAVQQFRGAACLISASENRGRAFGRNRLEHVARSDWMVFLDADMVPDDASFLQRYIEHIQSDARPALVVGGFSLQQAKETHANELHWAQCEVSECLPASERAQNPGRFVFTSNVLVHKQIMSDVPFDTAFSGWGWEDVDWGLRAAERFPVHHIDNTATHLGLDTPDVLLKKYGQSGRNFWLAAHRHPDALKDTSLYRLAGFLAPFPGKSLLAALASMTARLPGWSMPKSIRLFALKLYRATVYAEAAHEQS
ncbi:glycosyltransferase family 2 protein [Ponticaulis profundi]|uniref:Glycosyltransferase family 2 protein n=1 Tax=Ponticaulis profundi TaxID=2665222 RepID=A0ABW1S7B8_9PROT